jgi:hypothetical protein
MSKETLIQTTPIIENLTSGQKLLGINLLLVNHQKKMSQKGTDRRH